MLNIQQRSIKPRIAEAVDDFEDVWPIICDQYSLFALLLAKDTEGAINNVMRTIHESRVSCTKDEAVAFAIGSVWTFGRQKHGEQAKGAWRTYDRTELWNKVWRHYCDGDGNDAESGLPARWHMLFNLLAIRWQELNRQA
ncbi:dATP/dGTP diphosphohydrolase domain-containing protein [Candidatus Magnetaquicoccus inordinatus]|uniref:dATP/dGTP diphosphohydrolase domain-containing protein n=1 Tax=Candidatus Magnetaquicoccus inordinatus TaxID=2496818 RepID=UPI001290F1D7|nr:dATP/dGTP diphosphohydrolase domain-containing protein [Candidatus Magnetaquicoccus inordinatus]